jgi:hypothetical protein
MEEPPPLCPSGGLMALLTAMDARRIADPSDNATGIQGPSSIHVLVPVEDDAPQVDAHQDVPPFRQTVIESCLEGG